MNTDTKNGHAFAKFINDNDLYNESYFCEDYEQFLSYTNNREGFWNDFEYSMDIHFNKPIKL